MLQLAKGFASLADVANASFWPAKFQTRASTLSGKLEMTRPGQQQLGHLGPPLPFQPSVPRLQLQRGWIEHESDMLGLIGCWEVHWKGTLGGTGSVV